MPKNQTAKNNPSIGKIEIDRETCIGAASCVAVAPGVYELDEEGKARVKDLNGDSQQAILDAAKSCPVNAIKVFDAAGKQIYPKS